MNFLSYTTVFVDFINCLFLSKSIDASTLLQNIIRLIKLNDKQLYYVVYVFAMS